MALSDNQKEQIRNIDAIQMSAGLLGSIGGLIYAGKTGGGFWRYIGFWIAGGLAVGLPAMLVATPFKNKILGKGDKPASGDASTIQIPKEKIDAINKMIETATKSGADIFEGLTAEQKNTVYNQFSKLSLSEIDVLTKLFVKKEKSWTASEKVTFFSLFERATGKKIKS